MPTKHFKITEKMLNDRCDLYERYCTAHDKRALAAGHITQEQFNTEQNQLHSLHQPTTTTSTNTGLVGQTLEWDDEDWTIIATATDGIIVEKNRPST